MSWNGSFPFYWQDTDEGWWDSGMPHGQGSPPPPPFYQYGAIPIDKQPVPEMFFTLRGRRPNAMGDDRNAVEFCLHKCKMSDLVQLLSGDETQGIRFKAKALDDSGGDYGGSAEQPYGWAHLTKEGTGPQPHPAPPADIVVTNDNKWMDILYTIDGETFFPATIAVATGTYGSYGDLAVAMTTALNTIGGTLWSVTVEGDGRIKIARVFINVNVFTVRWKTGLHGSDNANDHIGTLTGFDDSADDSSSPAFFIISDQVPPFE